MLKFQRGTFLYVGKPLNHTVSFQSDGRISEWKQPACFYDPFPSRRAFELDTSYLSKIANTQPLRAKGGTR